MDLKQKLPLAFALVVGVMLSAGLGGLWATRQALNSFDADVLSRVADERAVVQLQTHFQRQMLDWKHTLLRGSDARLLALHQQGFARELQAVRSGAEALQGRLQDDETRQMLAAFRAAYAQMNEVFRVGFEKYRDTGFDASVGDMAVRGADQEPARLLQALAERIAAQAQAQAQTSQQLGRRAVAVASVLLLVGAAAGVGLGVLIGRRVTRPLRAAVRLAGEVAAGDLTQPIAVPQQRDETGRLLQALADMQLQLRRLVDQVRGSAESVARASGEIAGGSTQLSQRTERQAAALQQTAASMQQLDDSARRNADSALQANDLAQRAQALAGQGGQVVGEAEHTMAGIRDSARRIADITGVIDGIAFQTNILALNAAVEAARAGEQGRGFAVVAGEVRALAQRSAQAAREVKSLIGDSVARVEAGGRLVGDAGGTMGQVAQAIAQVSALIAEISQASRAQSQGVSEIGQAMQQLDQGTQMNAALVEEAGAAAESLRQQARELVVTVGQFRL